MVMTTISAAINPAIADRLHPKRNMVLISPALNRIESEKTKTMVKIVAMVTISKTVLTSVLTRKSEPTSCLIITSGRNSRTPSIFD